MLSAVLFNESKYRMTLKFLKTMRKQSNFLLTIFKGFKNLKHSQIMQKMLNSTE